jgi:prepilin-type N-terminal cleavage/methylation domain-containing protein
MGSPLGRSGFTLLELLVALLVLGLQIPVVFALLSASHALLANQGGTLPLLPWLDLLAAACGE